VKDEEENKSKDKEISKRHRERMLARDKMHLSRF
jgi:hypothetical protein